MLRTRWLAGLAIAGLALAAVPTLFAATSSTITNPIAIAYGGTGVLMTWGAGMLLWARPRDRRMATLLFVLAAGYAVRGLNAADDPWVYTLARSADPVSEVLLLWVVLAFPSGHLRSLHDRVIMWFAGVTVMMLWVPVVLFSRDIPMRNALTPCRDNCPRNTLMVTENPALVAPFLEAFQVVAAAVLVAAAVSLGLRLHRASALTQRTLALVFIAAIARLLVVALWLGTRNVATPMWLRLVSFWLIPVAIVLGLLIARLYTASTLERLVSGMQRRPNAQELQEVMADALRDPGLRIVYWVPEVGGWSQHGRLLDGPVEPEPRQVVTPLTSHGRSIAAVVHDEALLEQPELVDAVLASARIALEANRLQEALAASDAVLAEAPTQARRALERDLHDGAQQRLIALRMKVSVVSRLFEQDPRRAAKLAEELGPDIDATLTELRDLSHGRGPARLEAGGLGLALADLATRAGPDVTLRASGLGRYRTDVESAVYYICSEALQNCAKHAGASAHVDLRVRDDGEHLQLTIADDGPGCLDAHAGLGVPNMRERATALGGDLAVVATPGVGTVVSGRVRYGWALIPGEATPDEQAAVPPRPAAPLGAPDAITGPHPVLGA